MMTRGLSDEQLDLALAAELQAALLPKRCPIDCAHQVAAARNRMCGTIGGDFHDFIRINEDQVALLIGDVVGHGVRSSLLMAQIMGYLRSEPESRNRPSQVVADLNRMLISLGNDTDSVLPCSLFYTVMDAPTGVCFYVNAGHPKPFLCDRNTGKTHHLGSSNLLLGIQESVMEEGCITFLPGQRLVMYTDGIVDAANPADEHFGDRNLRHLIQCHMDRDPAELTEVVFQALDEFCQGTTQKDDQTVVVVDRL